MLIMTVTMMYALWSSMFSLAKVALQYSPPIFLTAVRMGIGSVILLTYLVLTKKSLLKLSKVQLLSITLLGFFSIYLTNVLEFWALQYLTAAKACFIYSLSPFFTAFFSYLHFGEKMNLRKWIGLTLGVMGMIPILLLQTGSEGLLSAFHFLSWPSLAMIGASLASVYGWVLLRLMVRDHNMSPLVANGGSMLVGSMIALIHSFYVESWNPTPLMAGSMLPFLGWTTLMALISNIICYNIYGMLLKRLTATFLSFMGLLSPVFASLHGWIFLGEVPSWLIFISTVTVSLGLFIVYYTELHQGYLTKQKVTA
ncbi:DMT family transporter [Rhabdochlamydiaceae symbiont of Dictyostelium giganteum]|uniref:DMT family transporter n=1 Tax=Rhabdochlamydiaceae symbiont of Dictyostelium giganteum TaxID=3342349 RepID=UPI00384E6B58